MKILIMGLPDSGKTTLARRLAKYLGAAHFNADEVRQTINSDLGFSREDRIQQARTMGALCDLAVSAGRIAIADFVCPTDETRQAFGKVDLTIFMNTHSKSRYADTNGLFSPPEVADIVITSFAQSNELLNLIKE